MKGTTVGAGCCFCCRCCAVADAVVAAATVECCRCRCVTNFVVGGDSSKVELSSASHAFAASQMLRLSVK